MNEDDYIEDFDFQDDSDFEEDENSSERDYYSYTGKDPNELYKELSSLPEETLAKKLDIDSLLKYDYEKRKQNAFQKEYGLEESDAIEYQNKLKESFRDYLILRNITGRQRGLFYHNIIPLDRIQDSGKIVEVFDDRRIKETLDQQKSTIIVHKSNSDDIDVLEVLCSCGKRTFIKLDYNTTDSAVIYSEGEHYPVFEEEIQDLNQSNDGFLDINDGVTQTSSNIVEEFDFGDDNLSSSIPEDYNFEEFTKS